MAVDYINVPDEMLDRPIEPWHPQVGDRVRVVLNLECQVPPAPGDDYSPDHLGHFPFEDGQTGVVVDPEMPGINAVGRAHAIAHGHPFPVMFDSWVSGGGCWYAACELEPLPADAPPERAEGR